MSRLKSLAGRELVAVSGVAASTLRQFEAGRSGNPSLRTVERVARPGADAVLLRRLGFRRDRARRRLLTLPE